MKKDVVFLVADKQMEETIRGLMSRSRALHIRNLTFEVYAHPHRDSGCYNEAPAFFHSMQTMYESAIVMFDYHGCGQEERPAQEIEADLEQRLAENGWQDRSCAIVLNPELEIWVWSDSPQVDKYLGWADKTPDLRTALRTAKYLEKNSTKPADPKAAVEWALRQVGKPRSARIFRELAENVSLNRCTDSSFRKFRETLQAWFGAK